MDRMNANETLERIRTLSVAPRVSQTPGHAAATQYVLDALKGAGWDAHIEEVPAPWGGGKLHNVVADRPGSAPDGQRGLVVAGAHLDTVRRAPGANDDGSGSATLIELAEALKDLPTRNDLKFIWFDGEEEGLLGSRAHVKANPQDTARTLAMVNMDMVGSPFGSVGYDIGRHTSNAMNDAERAIEQRVGISAKEHPRHERSDHASFDNVGIPAIDFGVGVDTVEQEDPNYHSPQDTIDKINTKVLEGYGDLIGTTLYDFANRDARIK